MCTYLKCPGVLCLTVVPCVFSAELCGPPGVLAGQHDLGFPQLRAAGHTATHHICIHEGRGLHGHWSAAAGAAAVLYVRTGYAALCLPHALSLQIASHGAGGLDVHQHPWR